MRRIFSKVTGRDIHSEARARGFTIVELLIVIVVIAILAAIVFVAYTGITARANASSAQAAAEQAGEGLKTYAVTNGGQYPSSLATAGVNPSGSTTFQYTYNNSASPTTFCVTATTANVSYYVDSAAHTSPTAGACAGQAPNGEAVVTNLVNDPEATGNTVEYQARYNEVQSFVSDATDGPIPALHSYVRMTTSSSITMAGMGIDHIGNIDLTSPPATTNWPVVSGQALDVSAYVRSSIAVSQVQEICEIYTPSGGWTTPTLYGPNYSASAGVWTQVTLSATPTVSGYLACSTRLESSETYPAGATIDETGLMVTVGPTSTNFADGNSPGWTWTGAPNDSTSTGPAL